jgi:hypothetical protein
MSIHMLNNSQLGLETHIKPSIFLSYVKVSNCTYLFDKSTNQPAAAAATQESEQHYENLLITRREDKLKRIIYGKTQRQFGTKCAEKHLEFKMVNKVAT